MQIGTLRLSALPRGAAAMLAVALPLAAGVQAKAAEAQKNDKESVSGPIIVTASPLPVRLDELAAPVLRLDQIDIDESGTSTLGALLGEKPGVTQSSFAAGASRPIIRGMDNNRVRVQENGISAGGVSALSEDHGVPIDPLSATSIEVVRGPATLRYGSEAIGGVVNVLNDRIPSARPDGGYTVHGGASYDSVDQGKQAYGALNAATGNLVWHADGFRRKTSDYDTPQGEQFNTWTDTSGVAGGASVLLDNGYAGASVTHYDSEYGIPAPEDPTDPVHIDMRQTKLQVRSGLSFGGWVKGLNLSGGYGDYRHDEITLSGVTGSTFKNKEWEGRAEFLHASVGPFAGAFGVQYHHRDLSASGEGGELLAPTNSHSVAGFLFEEMPLGDTLSLQMAGRVEHVKVEGTALDTATITEYSVSRDFTPLSGSAGLVWDLDGGWVTSATFQAAQRAPKAPELFSKGPHEATETFEIGDAALNKETAYSAELSARREGRGYSFAASLFHVSFDDFIYKALTGATCDDDYASCTDAGGTGTELNQVRYAQRDATFYGFELEGKVALLRTDIATYGLTGQADYVRAKFDGGTNVPRIPPMRIGAGVYLEADRFMAKAGFLHAFKQDKLGPNETETAGYTNVSAVFRYTLPEQMTGGASVKISVIGQNLLDADIRNHVSFKKNDVLLPGRNFRLVASVDF